MSENSKDALSALLHVAAKAIAYRRLVDQYGQNSPIAVSYLGDLIAASRQYDLDYNGEEAQVSPGKPFLRLVKSADPDSTA